MTDIEQAIIELNVMRCKYSHIRKNDSEWFAIETAQEALREKQERENPKPLTLDELKARVGNPVYIKCEWMSEWGVFDRSDGEDAWFALADHRERFNIYEYGKTWIAYDHKPKEA